MPKIYKALTAFLLLAAALAFALPAFAAERLTINGLIENALLLDGTEVTVEGEVLGEALERGEFAWLNISDGTNAIGIWVSAADAQRVSVYGDYKHIGDTVKITGIFHRACTEHGGDIDIHCAVLEIVSAGYTVREEAAQGKIAAAAILLAAALAAALVYRKVMSKNNPK